MMDETTTTVEHTTYSSARRLHEFDPVLYDWEEWEILFDTYVAVEDVSDDTKKLNLLITLLGVQPFKTLISVCKPKRPTEYSYEEIILKLRTNYARITFPSTERVKFFSMKQTSSQSLTDFSNSIRDHATTCKFPESFYEQALITAFVGGLINDRVRKHLMQQNLETFEQTLNTAKVYNSVLEQGANKNPVSSEELTVNKIEKRSKTTTAPTNTFSCASCGGKDHPRSKCRFRNVSCYKCEKEGHIAKVCRSKQIPTDSSVNTIFSISQERDTNEKRVQIPVQIDGILVNLEFDTGSPISVINEGVWKAMGKPHLSPVKSNYTSFSGHSVRFKGEKMVQVKYDDEDIPIKVIVGYGNHKNILGRDWINALHLSQYPLEKFNTTINSSSIKSEVERLE